MEIKIPGIFKPMEAYHFLMNPEEVDINFPIWIVDILGIIHSPVQFGEQLFI